MFFSDTMKDLTQGMIKIRKENAELQETNDAQV